MDIAMVWEKLTSGILENDFLQGGLVISLFTATWMYAKRIPAKISALCKRYFTIHVTFQMGDQFFNPVLSLVYNIHKNSGFGEFYNMRSHLTPKECDSSNAAAIPAGRRWHRQGLSFIATNLASRDLDNAETYDATTYDLTVSVYGWGRRKALDNFLQKSIDFLIEESKSRDIYQWTDGRWDYLQKLPERSPESLVIADKNEILQVLDKFQSSKDWYHSRGIPYRKGIAFHGPPGTGKSSIALSIANYLDKDLYLINLSTMTGNGIRKALSGNNKLFLIEDIDVASESVKTRDKQDPSKLVSIPKMTLADLLNAIDGATSGSGNILIVTTNDLAALDKALIRPGRIDNIFELGYLSQELFDALCQLYYGETCGYVVEGDLTAADVQGIFIQNKHDIENFERDLWTRT